MKCNKTDICMGRESQTDIGDGRGWCDGGRKEEGGRVMKTLALEEKNNGGSKC